MTTFPPPAVTKLAKMISGHAQKLTLHTQQITTLQTTTAQQSTQIGTAQTAANAANTAAAAAQTTANTVTASVGGINVATFQANVWAQVDTNTASITSLPNWVFSSTKCATVDSISNSSTSAEINAVLTAVIQSLKAAGHMS